MRLDKAGNKADKKLRPGDQATEHTSIIKAEKVEEAQEAEEALVEDTVLFLYEHRYSTSYLKSVCTAGLKVHDHINILGSNNKRSVATCSPAA